jgi:hypothetical protein
VESSLKIKREESLKMIRKHGIVLSLFFVLLGMMFFSVDTPLILPHEVPLENTQPNQETMVVSDEADSMGNLRINVHSNPSYEEWDVVKPADYTDGYSSDHRDANFAYNGPGITGNYALLAEAESSSTTPGESYIYQNPSTSSLIGPGLSLSLDWNTLEIPTFENGGRVYIEVNTYDGAFRHRNLYYLLTSKLEFTNNSVDAWFTINGSINAWHTLDRNITEDYIAGWGAGDLNSNQYVQGVRLRTFSNANDPGMTRVVFDNIVLTNGTYSGWIINGDFETGIPNPWFQSQSTMGYIEQSTDRTQGAYSLNISVPDNSVTLGYSYVRRYFDYPGGYFAPSMDWINFEFDYKYNDTVSNPGPQRSYLRIALRNTSATYFLYLYFGTEDNNLLFTSNTTTLNSFKAPGFSIRDTWHHVRFDLYSYMSSVGYIANLSLYNIQFYVVNSAPSASVTLLVDDFNIITYPTGDPGFEEDWFMDSNTPFAGWLYWNGETGVISRTSDSLAGTYACNLTVENSDSAGIWRRTELPVYSSDLTNFSWRIDDMGVLSSHVDIMFRFSDDTYLYYTLGSGILHNPSNSSSVHYIRPSAFNVSGVWNTLYANLTHDAEEAFGPGADTTIIQFTIDTYASFGERVSVIFDELHFINSGDNAPPVVDSVDFLPAAPMYYDTMDVTIYTHDDRSGIQSVFVDYYNGSWWGLPATDMGGYFVATIPAHAYGTTVDFQVSVTDNSGHNTVDNNGGALYSYTVGDDIDPALAITNPVNNTEQEGLLAITATADDPGSGVEWVEFDPDGVSAIRDYTFPYSQNWNLDDASLGSHFIIVTVRDNAGHEVSKTHYITVVDTVDPVLDSPDDVEFTVGATGQTIDWDPTDIRPTSYEVFVDSVSTFTGDWNSTSEHIVINLEGLAIGEYNYTCVVYDDAGNSAVDTVIVTVNDVVTTPTTTTTSPTTTTTPPPPGDMTMLLVLAGAGVAVVIIVIVVLQMKKK